ncbi:MAG: hypothetical protein ACYDGS_07250 [Thermoleophilia bacterium]
MNKDDLGKLHVQRKTGKEKIHASGEEFFDHTLQGFWQWSGSDLVNNALRGTLAEYLVACDIGVADGTRAEWDAYDLLSREAIKIEIKSAAYLQSWAQNKLSSISFDIGPTFGWNASTNETSQEKKRQADVYIFCLFKHKKKKTVDPLDVDQWEFYVLATSLLDEKLPTQKSISLSTLLDLKPEKARFGEISVAINKVLS